MYFLSPMLKTLRLGIIQEVSDKEISLFVEEMHLVLGQREMVVLHRSAGLRSLIVYARNGGGRAHASVPDGDGTLKLINHWAHK